MTKPPSIDDCIARNLEKYFRELDGKRPAGVYGMLIDAVEKPMLEVVMRMVQNNQSRASDVLGINRNTLRKKLSRHGLLK